MFRQHCRTIARMSSSQQSVNNLQPYLPACFFYWFANYLSTQHRTTIQGKLLQTWSKKCMQDFKKVFLGNIVWFLSASLHLEQQERLNNGLFSSTYSSFNFLLFSCCRILFFLHPRHHRLLLLSSFKYVVNMQSLCPCFE